MSPQDHAEDLAKKLRGNWRRWDSFAWFDRPADAEEWAIVYTSNRDSDALTRSNARQYAKAMGRFLSGDDVLDFGASHWAVGHVDGYAIRVLDAEHNLTPAFLAYAELCIAEDDYSVLNESDFLEEEQREADQVWKNYRTKERVAYIRASLAIRVPRVC